MQRTLVTTLIILLLIIGGGVVVYVTDTFGLRSAVETRIARDGVRILEGTVHDRVMKEFDLFDEKEIPIASDKRLVDYVPQDGGYAITFDPETAAWEVVHLTDGANVLASSVANKLWLSIDPGAHFLAYGERTPLQVTNEQLNAVDVYNPAAWSVRLVDLKSGSTRTEVTGSMPRLFERDGNTYVLYLAPNQVRVRILLGEWQPEFVVSHFVDGLWPVEVSPDGKYMALFDMERMTYDIYEFDLANGAIVLKPLPHLPGQARILSFDGGHLLALMWSPEREAAYLAKIDLEHPDELPVILSERVGLDAVRKIIPAP